MSLSFCGKRLFLTRSCLLANQKRHGYIVLIPEIGEDLPDKNPLLREDGLPEFNKFTIENCVAAIGHQAINVEKGLKDLETALGKIDYEPELSKDIFLPLEQIGGPLETTWGLAKTLYLGNSSMMPTKSYLTIHERARRARAAKFNSMPIYNILKEKHESSKKSQLTDEDKRLLDKYLLEAKLNGNDINESTKFELNNVLHSMAAEKKNFRAKAEIATNQFQNIITDPAIMQEFPPSLLQALAVDQSQAVKGPWKVTLQPFVAKNFLLYCPDRAQRWNVHQADNRKCSAYAEKQLRNSLHVEQIRSFRHNQAKILGYDNFMSMSMETKMAGTVENVQNIFNDLMQYARPAQETEIHNLELFAVENGFQGNLDLYDLPYWNRRYCQHKYSYDNETIREYFPMPKVLSGLFRLAETLFDIKIVDRSSVDTWHEDVRYFDIFDAKDTKSPMAGFYTDLYTREDEKMYASENAGWMVAIRNKSKVNNTLPLSALICNFEAPLYGKPSLLSLEDVHMLFSKFGHALQHLLTQSNYSEVAGLSNIEWDAVEVSGHVMSHLLYDPKIIKTISSHYVTEDPLPDSLLNIIHPSMTNLAGYNLCREIYLSNLDMELHTSNDFWLDIVKRLWPQYHVCPMDPKESHVCSMTSIFSEEWGGAYFSHIWSKLIAADVYSAFYEATNKNEDIGNVGRRFRETFLSLGGSCHPSEVFRRFRGRDPSPKALLRTLKLYTSQPDPTIQKSAKEDK